MHKCEPLNKKSTGDDTDCSKFTVLHATNAERHHGMKQSCHHIVLICINLHKRPTHLV